jgi:hypothetical protein
MLESSFYLKPMLHGGLRSSVNRGQGTAATSLELGRPGSMLARAHRDGQRKERRVRGSHFGGRLGAGGTGEGSSAVAVTSK